MGGDESDGGRPDEAPWEVSEYRYEPPWLLDLMFWPYAGPPLVLLIGVALWRWLG